MGSQTERLQQDIDQTQQDIREDLTALEDKLNPASAAKRTASRMGDKLNTAKETMMGSAQEGMSQAGTAVSEVPERIERRTEGNPLAMGVLAFSIGWLIGSLLPATRMEQRQAAEIKSRASEAVEPVLDSAKSVAEDIKQEAGHTAHSLADEARQTASSVMTPSGDGKGNSDTPSL